MINEFKKKTVNDRNLSISLFSPMCQLGCGSEDSQQPRFGEDQWEDLGKWRAFEPLWPWRISLGDSGHSPGSGLAERSWFNDTMAQRIRERLQDPFWLDWCVVKLTGAISLEPPDVSLVANGVSLETWMMFQNRSRLCDDAVLLGNPDKSWSWMRITDLDDHRALAVDYA